MGWICSRCEKTFEDRSVSCVDCGAPLVVDMRGQMLAGRYRLDSVIGTGSQESSVWKAWQISFERPVAVKIMPAADELARERFARGARIASMLAHPHITTVHDYGETDEEQVFLVMEFLEGRVLREETGPAEPVPIDRVVHIAEQILRALEDAHSHAVVHRDLKPDNLFLTHRAGDPDFVKVLDFGIAKYFTVSDPEDTEQTRTMQQQLTHGWQLCGTPLYMAPEQISGEAVDGRTDLYALAVVMYQLLTGAVPFRAKTQYAVLSQHLRDAPPAFAEVRPGLEVPATLERLVMKALEKKPSDRFATAREMREELADVQAAMGLDAAPTDQERRRPSRGYPAVPGTADQTSWAFPLFVALAVLFGALVTHLAMDSLQTAPLDEGRAHIAAPAAATEPPSAGLPMAGAAEDVRTGPSLDVGATQKADAVSAARTLAVQDGGLLAAPAAARPALASDPVVAPAPRPRPRPRAVRGKPARTPSKPAKRMADVPQPVAPIPPKVPRKPRIQVLGGD